MKSNIDLQKPCAHVTQKTIRHVDRPPEGCPKCIAMGSGWVHLRICLTCGQVGCCDSSPNKHATAHFHETKHSLMTSGEEGETWAWCFVDEVELGA